MKSNPITLEALEVLDAIERRGSYAAAAEELDRATSALSYVVGKLEEQLDVTLFERRGRRSVLTPAGQVLLNEGRQLLDAAHQLRQRTLEVARGWETRLRVSVGVEANYTCVFNAIKGLLDDHPDIEIDVTEHVLAGGWDALEHDATDLVVCVAGPVPRQKGFRTEKISTNDMALVVARDHPLAKLADDANKLAEELPLHRRVVVHDSTRINVARNAGLTIGRGQLFVQNMDQKIAAQVAGLGVGHLPLSRIQRELADGSLVRLGVTGEHEDTPLYLAWRTTNRGKGLRALTQLLISTFEGA